MGEPIKDGALVCPSPHLENILEYGGPNGTLEPILKKVVSVPF